MRPLLFGSLTGAVLTFTTALALRAGDATSTVLASAAVLIVIGWYASLDATEDQSGLALIGPAHALVAALVGRQAWTGVLPLVAAQVVGAVAGGALALTLDDRWGPLAVDASPTVVVAAVVGLLVGVLTAWTVLAADGDGPVALLAAPTLVAGAVAPLTLIGLAQPAVIVGLATADLVPWEVAGAGAGAALAAATIGAYIVPALLPAD